MVGISALAGPLLAQGYVRPLDSKRGVRRGKKTVAVKI
jgi:hypothetical protein